MPYTESLMNLQQELNNNQNQLSLFLQTNTELYSFTSKLNENQQLEIIRPIHEYMTGKEFNKYDPSQIMVDTIYYITNEMNEYESLTQILEINNQIENNEVGIARIRSIETDRIKTIIFKKNNFLFLYRYNSSKLFKQGWKATFNEEEAIVEKEDNKILVLSKQIPDIIVDTDKQFAFIPNVKQAEYMLEINTLFNRTIDIFAGNLRQFNLMREDTIEMFKNQISAKNSYMRKLQKIQNTQSYQYFKDNINKIPQVLRQYQLGINFDQENGQIIFDENTDVGDVLHLFADDYVKRYISNQDDIIN